MTVSGVDRVAWIRRVWTRASRTRLWMIWTSATSAEMSPRARARSDLASNARRASWKFNPRSLARRVVMNDRPVLYRFTPRARRHRRVSDRLDRRSSPSASPRARARKIDFARKRRERRARRAITTPSSTITSRNTSIDRPRARLRARDARRRRPRRRGS